MDIPGKSVDMAMDMDGKFHIHSNPAQGCTLKTKEFLATPLHAWQHRRSMIRDKQIVSQYYCKFINSRR